MTPLGYALVGLTAVVAIFIGIMAILVARMMSGSQNSRRNMRETGSEVALLSAALQEAVTKLKAQEQATSARADASDMLRSQIANSLMAGLLVVDPDGNVQIFNPAGRRLLEAKGESTGVHYRQVLKSAEPLAAVLTECLESGSTIVRRAVEMPSTSRPLHFGVTVSPLAGPSDKRGAICLFSDLTNVVELEEQLRLKETLARLGEMTAGIAHEFRNGLATIHGYSRLIDPAALPTQYRPYIEGIRQEADVLGKVVTNFLEFAKPQQMALSEVDLGRIARTVADDIKHELPHGTSIDFVGMFGRIDGDDVLLRQVFSNLLRNAAEACVESGVTPIIVLRGDIDRSHKSCWVSVEDNGPGIPAAVREKVFQPFFTTRSRGTGLGLAIVQKIVVIHRGRVTLGTSPVGGAAVRLNFQSVDQNR